MQCGLAPQMGQILDLETLGREGNLDGGPDAWDDLERAMARLTPALADFTQGSPASHSV